MPNVPVERDAIEANRALEPERRLSFEKARLFHDQNPDSGPDARARRAPPKQSRPRFSLSAKVLVLLLPLVLAFMVSLSWFQGRQADLRLRQELAFELRNFTRLQSTAIAPILWNLDMGTLRKMFRGYADSPDVKSVALYGKNGRILLKTGDPAAAATLRIRRPVIYEHAGTAIKLGTLQVAFRDTRLRQDRERRAAADRAAYLGVTALLAISIFLVLRFRVRRPLTQLLASLERAAHDRVREPVPWTSTDELGQVVNAYNRLLMREATAETKLQAYGDHLEDLVAQRTRELEHERNLLRSTLQRLAEREATLHAIIESAGVGIVSTDANGIIIDANEDFCSLVGLSREQVAGRTLPSVLHPGEADAARDGFEELARGAIKRFRLQVRLLRNAFDLRWATLTVAPLVGAGGEVTQMVGVVTDITEHKAAEERFRALLESAPDAMVVTRTDGTIAMLNRRAENLFGFAREDLVDMPAVALLPERLRHRDGGETSVSPLGISGGEVLVAARDGREIPVEVSSSPIVTDQGTLIASTLRDVTLRRRAEAEMAEARTLAEAANRAKSEFLANMSHEIRTPMNAIIGLAHLALGNDPAPKQREFVEKIHAAARSLLAVINDILDFSKIEANKLVLEEIDFHLDQIFESLTDTLGIKASEKGLALIFTIEPGLPAVLVGDPVRLNQVLVNLVANAVKFTEHGEVRISCEAAGQRDGRLLLRFAVTDTGIGMTAEQIRTLFTPFSQADSSITRRFGGTGLGLAICHRLVEMMGGEIVVDSTFGQGTIVSFTVPFASAADGDDAATDPSAEGTALAGRRILLVEDNELNQVVVRELLTAYGATVIVADNGREGMKALERDRFDAVLMDVQMPEMDGYTATRLIREDPRLAGLPVIAMTANAMAGDRELALAAGMNDHVTKPIDLTAMFGTLARWLGTGPIRPTTIDGNRPPPAIGAEKEEEEVGAAVLITRLRTLVAEDDTDALEIAENLAAALADGAWEAKARLLATLLRGYDFRAARRVLDEIDAGIPSDQPASDRKDAAQ